MGAKKGIEVMGTFEAISRRFLTRIFSPNFCCWEAQEVSAVSFAGLETPHPLPHYLVLEIEPRALHMIGNYSTTELHAQ